jgi:hypothetical protein
MMNPARTLADNKLTLADMTLPEISHLLPVNSVHY